jgi:signal transduction histidine kinase
LYVSRHEPRRTEAGSGLGLAIVRELVTAHGGRVEASAATSGGACLSVVLPLERVTSSS